MLSKYLAFLIVITFILPPILGLSCTNNKDPNLIEASGNIEVTEVIVSSKSTGEILKLFINEGSRIKKGDTLACIDHTNLDIRLSKALAQVEGARAQLRLVVKGARIEDIMQARENSSQAMAQVRSALSDLNRAAYLYRENSGTEKQLEDAQMRYDVTMAQYNASQQVVKKLERGSRKEEIDATTAMYKQAMEEVNLTNKLIRDCSIIAPANGIITHKPFEVGELVTEGSPVATITRLDTVQVVIYVTELELGRVKLNQEAEIRIDALPKRVFKGHIIYISPDAEFTPKSIQTKEERVKLVYGVKIEIPNTEGILKNGMPCDASLR